MKVLSVFLIVFIFPSLAAAQIYQCDGKWTNKPCDGQVQQVIQETSSATRTDNNRPILSEKKSLLHELRMKSIRARREYDLTFNLSEVETFCLHDTSSVSDCRERIEATEDRIDYKVSELATLQMKREELEAKKKKLREEENSQVAVSNPGVLIVERRYHRYPRKRRHHLHPRDPHHYPHKPHHPRRPRGWQHGSSGINVSLEGSTPGGGHLSVQGSAGGSVVNFPNRPAAAPHGRPRLGSFGNK